MRAVARMVEEPRNRGGYYDTGPDFFTSVGPRLAPLGQRNAFVEEFVGRRHHRGQGSLLMVSSRFAAERRNFCLPSVTVK